jgi:hypothetical protein
MMYFLSPKTPSKAHLQALLYNSCTNAYLDLYIAYWINTPKICFDAVLIEGVEIIAIVEVLKTSKPRKNWNRGLGIPVFSLSSEYDIPDLIKSLQAVRQEYLRLNTDKSIKIFSEKGKRDSEIQSVFTIFDSMFPSYILSEKFSRHLLVDVYDRFSLECVMFWLDKTSQQCLSEEDRLSFLSLALKRRLNNGQ